MSRFAPLLLCLALAGPAFAQQSAEPATEPTFRSLASGLYIVPDLEEATAWYATALGVQPYFEESYYVGFRIGEQELGLVPAEGDDAPGAGGAIPYWLVEDADAALAHLLESGAAAHYPVTDVGGGVLVASVKDPYGNVIGIIEMPEAAE